jgi:pimeloyl-ACP methyl ester carboxylesterase
LVSGLDTRLEVWEGVRSGLSGFAPVFSYDRGGVGGSGAVTGTRPSSVVAEELRATLVAAGVRPPYVLVAHSIGGLHARVFAHRYPQDVAGVVLVDATPEAVLAMMAPTDIEDVASQMQYAGSRAEVRAQLLSVAEVTASRLPDVPLSVITSMQAAPGEGPGAREWIAQLQGEWLRQVRRAEQVRTDAGHMVPLEAPAVIVEATQRVLTGGVR